MSEIDPVALEKAVAEAMQEAWDDICLDTGCHPLDIEREGRKLTFRPSHWAKFTAMHLQGRLAIEATPTFADGVEAAAKVVEDGFTRPVAVAYFPDRPSKHDKCPHDRALYEDCEQCCAIAIRNLLPKGEA